MLNTNNAMNYVSLYAGKSEQSAMTVAFYYTTD
jgi:hypothetical protein